MPSPIDIVIILLTFMLPLSWYFRNSLPLVRGKARGQKISTGNGVGHYKVEEGDPRDFVGKMERGVSSLAFRSMATDRHLSSLLISLSIYLMVMFLDCRRNDV